MCIQHIDKFGVPETPLRERMKKGKCTVVHDHALKAYIERIYVVIAPLFLNLGRR